ncbi:MAG: hypothetical protein JWN35_1795 [Frankiales bacterium]|jgi:hypothetical protein|nr:hypothetical protein [Frankiales bacterium]
MYRDGNPHDVVEHGLPPEAGLAEVLDWAVAHAALAPSEHNSQPWSFLAYLPEDETEARVELYLDPSRQLPFVDSDNREALLACGAALLNLRLALAGAEYGTQVTLMPDPSRPELLARVVVQGPPVEGDLAPDLLFAVPRRGTHRAPFQATAVPVHEVDRLVAEAAAEGAVVTPLDVAGQEALARLTAAAETELWEDGAYRREAAAWSRANDTSQRDGVPGYAYGLGAIRSWLRPTLCRTAGLPPWSAQDIAEAERGAPLVLVISATGDGRPAVLRAGAGMQRLLLRACSDGLTASYVNGALHVPALRRQLAALTQSARPQVVLRLGYGQLPRPTPRRTVPEILRLEHPSE